MASRNPVSVRPTGRWQRRSPAPAPVPVTFDLTEFRRQRFAGGLFCPRCRGRRIHRWGSQDDRRRYRCLACGRTFNDLTGTPMAYLKNLDRWARFCHYALVSSTVRRTAACLRVSVSTAFRWRHRLLDALRERDQTGLAGHVVLAETWFPFSEKGRRDLDRPAHRRGQLWPSQRAWVLLARDLHSRPFAALTGLCRPRARQLGQALQGRLEPDINLCDGSGPLGQVAHFARQRHLGYRRLRGARLRHNPATAYGVAVRRWLRPFQGVATRYLPNYLAWHRFLALCHRCGLDPDHARTRLIACAFP